MSENIQLFFTSITIILQDIKELSVKYKNEPRLGLTEIIKIAQSQGYDLNIEELKKVITTFMDFKKEELKNKEYKTKTITLEGCSNKAVTGNETYDQITYYCLQYLDNDFLESVYQQKS
ncbi:MAG: hypothetical protein HWQ44_00225 [Nostoc sp. JL34]|nr:MULTISPECIES: hypothetical protein [Nostoc]MBN3881440.1 hypothetical protein [Nostoc sp. JL34]